MKNGIVERASDRPPSSDSHPAVGAELGRLRAFAREHAPGTCKILSRNDDCLCPLCDIDRIAASIVIRKLGGLIDSSGALFVPGGPGERLAWQRAMLSMDTKVSTGSEIASNGQP